MQLPANLPQGCRPQPWPVQVLDLTMIQLSNWRWSWRGMIITGMIAPLASITALGLFARTSGPQALAYVLTGNVVLSLMFENLDKVASNFAFMKAMGTLYYFASLPIRRYSLVLATVCAFFLLSLPALLVTIMLGALILEVPLHFHPLILAVVPMVTLPLSGLGALIGTAARGPEEAGPLTTLLTFVLLAIGPVIIPPDRLPPPFLTLGWFSPAVYAASAMRQVLIGPVTLRLALDLGVLTLVTVIVFWLVGRKMDWRPQG